MKKTGNVKRILINLLIIIVVGLIYFYLNLPAINLRDPAFYTFFIILAGLYCVLSIVSQGVHKAEDGRSLWEGIKKNCAIPIILCLALAAIFIVGNVISSPIFRARSYRDLLVVTDGDFTADVAEISFDQIPMLDEDSATRLGDRKLGELSDMVSQFEVATDYTQINYKGKPVRVTPLLYGDIIKWFNNRPQGLPAYMIIDMVTQGVEVVRIRDIMPGETGMKYSTNEHFSRNLYRFLRFQYPTFMFDLATFEIDDDGIPYWVCPRIVKRIGLFGGTDIRGAVLVNAVTGENVYCDQGEVPEWVDRVYTAELITQQYDYHGIYQNGFINSFLGQRGVTVTTDGFNYLAVEGDVHMYTGITSVGTDESNVGFILTNQRTKETKYYPIAGAEEYSAMNSAQGIVQHLNYVSTFPLLLNIAGQPTYFMALKDSAGLVKMYAMVNVQQYQIVASGPTLAQCNQNYAELLIHHNIDGASTIVSDFSVSGTIEDIRTAVKEGDSLIYIKLEDDPAYYVFSVDQNELAIILNPGDQVIISAIGGGDEILYASSIERK